MDRTLLLVVGLLAPAVLLADESQFALKDGPGREKVVANCTTCHSLDYIPMNSPFADRKLWEAEVNKMINAYAAPISKEDIPQIVDYLDKYYGSR
jgi:sulfite dehydrogenase (cytochrome) subunit B